VDLSITGVILSRSLPITRLAVYEYRIVRQVKPQCGSGAESLDNRSAVSAVTPLSSLARRSMRVRGTPSAEGALRLTEIRVKRIIHMRNRIDREVTSYSNHKDDTG
jgi:hypothetical protein